MPSPDELLQSVRRVPHEIPDPNEPKVTVRVARGRVVDVPHPTEKVRVGLDQENRSYIDVARQVRHGPGQLIELPQSEAARLVALGFVEDPETEHVVNGGRAA